MDLKICKILKIFDEDGGVLWKSEICEKMTCMTPLFLFIFMRAEDVASQKDQIYKLWSILSPSNRANSLIIQRRFLFPAFTPIIQTRRRKNRAAELLRQAANALVSSSTSSNTNSVTNDQDNLKNLICIDFICQTVQPFVQIGNLLLFDLFHRAHKTMLLASNIKSYL